MTDPAEPPQFDEAFKARLQSLFVWRRDVRRFREKPLPRGLLRQLIETACLAPSVGLSQPWRFVLVDDPDRRAAILENYNRCNAEALSTYAGDRAALYARLKLAGLKEAPHHLAVYADEATREGGGLGQRTMAETVRYSVVAAICQLWLAARAEGVGMGWVSILDPTVVDAVLQVPPRWRLIGYFCLGYPELTADTPELALEGWERRRGAADVIVQR